MTATEITARQSKGLLTNLDTGQPIRWACWCNLETGEYRAYRIDPKIAKARGIPLASILYQARARLSWQPTPILRKTEAQAPAPRPAIRRRGTPIIAHAQRPCQTYGCIRLADWSVAVERALPAVSGAEGTFSAAELVETRWYCSWHYQRPQLWDARGELICEHEVLYARPQ